MIDLIVPTEEILVEAVIGEELTISLLPSKISSVSGVPIAMIESPMLMLAALITVLPGDLTMVAASAILTSFLPSLSSITRVVPMTSLIVPT